MNGKKIDELPSSKDEFWDGETITESRRTIHICETHAPENYMEHIGYVDTRDGAVTCKYCPWGGKLPGYLRVADGRLVDLRTFGN